MGALLCVHWGIVEIEMEGCADVSKSSSSLKRAASTSSEKPRTAWCPVILKCKKSYELHILWKDVRNRLKLFKYRKSKEPFGRVLKSNLVTEKNAKQELGDYYKMATSTQTISISRPHS